MTHLDLGLEPHRFVMGLGSSCAFIYNNKIKYFLSDLDLAKVDLAHLLLYKYTCVCILSDRNSTEA